MRCIIAGQSFYLQPSDVERAMVGVKPEPIQGHFVEVGRQKYPVKQVGAVISGQRPSDFTVQEVRLALTHLGFACGSAS